MMQPRPPRARLHREDAPQVTPALDKLFEELDAIAGRMTPFAPQLRHNSIAHDRAQVDFYYRVASSPAIRTICEVGFNMGHSAAVWLSANPTAHVHSFDLLLERGPRACRDHLRDRFAGRFTMHRGDSTVVVPQTRPRLSCDLVSPTGRASNAPHPSACPPVRPRARRAPGQVHVDGRHDYYNTAVDALNLLAHSTDHALYLFDDQCDP